MNNEDTNKLILACILQGGTWDKIYENCRRVYSVDGIAPTIPTCGGVIPNPK